MSRCARCGLPIERYTVEQRYCALCLRELALREAKPEPVFLPVWRRKPIRAKDMTRYAA